MFTAGGQKDCCLLGEIRPLIFPPPASSSGGTANKTLPLNADRQHADTLPSYLCRGGEEEPACACVGGAGGPAPQPRTPLQLYPLFTVGRGPSKQRNHF